MGKFFYILGWIITIPPTLVMFIPILILGYIEDKKGWVFDSIKLIFFLPIFLCGIVFFIGIAFRDEGERMCWPKLEGAVKGI